MLKFLSDKRTKTSYNSPIKSNQKIKKTKSLSKFHRKTHYKPTKGCKTQKYTNNKYSLSKILKLEKNLTRKENRFKQNISDKISSNEKLSRNIYNNIALLKNNILDNYNTLKISTNNYYNTFKQVKKTLSNEKTHKVINKEINKEIYKLKNDIDEIQNKIEEI